MVYRCDKQHNEPGSDRREQRNAKRGAKHGAQADELHLTPLALIARLAALVPPPRAHRHRHYGVLAPNSPLRAAAVVLADARAQGPWQAQAGAAQAESSSARATGEAMGAATGVLTKTEPSQPVQPKRPAHILWAVLIARI